MKKSRLRRHELPGKIVVHTLLVLFCLTTIVPLWLTVSISLSDSATIAASGYTFLPQKFSLQAYEWIFNYPKQLITGYKNSMILTVFGTLLNVAVTALIAYPLSRQDFRYKGAVNKFMFFTMIFNGGTASTYIVIVNYLGLKNSLLSLMLPAIALPYYVFLLRVMFQEIPHSLIEAAKIDGCSDFKGFLRIVLPLSKPALATIVMMYALMYWNEATNAILYIDLPEKYPVTLILNNIVSVVNQIKGGNVMPGSGITVNAQSLPGDSIMFAMVVVSCLPMLFLFTFMQKYFVRGMVSGAVKG